MLVVLRSRVVISCLKIDDSYAWRAGYYDPPEWQVMPDLKLPKGSLYEKYGDQFRLMEDEEEERKRRSLIARSKGTSFSQTDDIASETVSVQTSDEETHEVKEESNSHEITEESNSSQISNESSKDTTEEPVLIKTEECEKESNDFQTDDTEELSSNPDSETVSLASSATDD